MVKRKTHEEYIQEVKQIYGDKYNYSKIKYLNNKAKIVIICQKHGEFQKRADSFLNGSECQKCFYEDKARMHKKDQVVFIEELQNLFGNKYDYSMVQYINAYTPIKIHCPEHGLMIKTPRTILQNHMVCYKCNYMDTKKFIEEANNIHDNKYDYNKTDFVWCHKKVIITCPKHGDFYQEPRTHLANHGCPVCRMSFGEKALIKYFESNDIIFNYQKRICKDKKLFCVFDFYLPSFDLYIEYDGNIHFKETPYNLEKIRYRDLKKDDYIISHNLKLLRIHYKDLDKIPIICKDLTKYQKNLNYSRINYYGEATVGVKSVLPTSH